MAKPKKIESRSVEELKEMANTLDREIYSLRNELALQRKLEKPHLLKMKRREKARVLTALTQTLRQQGVA